ncbi:DUF2461 domain-containing protein [Croceimicrobium hydrocarbonivorans]|uniref:DUF2461 domain-containing protein n=1 Tax=Croceimicrobium hydrocarbonivorans TaxID=2761580 RepID=A0A7H0VI61_9FLAO|nr:DUF2461 domain-containing protein [Croceimicrobium hydrocarbonivorans]QNR25409.1 DUF2461 domain-containing protein [Croceimicrobium hydrocarbonivorans]
MKAPHPDTYQFLEALKVLNTKEWMDANRKWYQDIRQGLIDYAGQIQETFAEVYPMTMMDPKKYLARINNNRRFHPDKPPYKTNFALMVKRRGPGYGDFYLHIEPGNLFIGTGLYHPAKEHLLALRDLIDVRGDELKAIEEDPQFKKVYGAFRGDKLQRNPKGFELDHPHIELLKHKDLLIMKQLDEQAIFTAKGLEELKEAFAAAIPFMDFIDDAISQA